MNKLLIILFFFGFTNFVAFAQTNTASGIIADLSSNAKLHNASISILNAKDSTLYKYTRANQDGTFSFKNCKNGDFILLVTYPEYADFVNRFSLNPNQKSIDFKTIDMKTKAKLLNEVIIKGQTAAIKIKGDTTEFNAKAYNIKPNDRVEDLIKQFPGIQIDAQGKITAQGKTVEKVLVDGEEFFGDDPTLVTKNLRADMVDKVQLFEKASDQAAFTGVDDGQKKQTLNIVLKDDKKRGYFGKVDAGLGTDKTYEGQAMINKFRNKEKMAAYFTGSKTAKTGLGWDDAGKYGASGNMQMSDDGSMMFFSSGEDFDNGSYRGEGVPTTYNGGFHYENKWNSEKESINANYKIADITVDKIKNTFTQNSLTDGALITNANENSTNHRFRQKVDFTYTTKIDSTSNLKVILDGTAKTSDSESYIESNSNRADQTAINDTKRTTTNDAKEQLFNFSALYNKKLKKLGRNFSVNLANNYSKTNADRLLKADNNFYDDLGNFVQNEYTDQLRDDEVVSNRLSTNITYNEPISKTLTLVSNYGLSLSQSKNHRKTYDAAVNGDYDQLNTEYTNNFNSDQLINQVGAIFNYKNGKTTLNFGTKTSFANFNQIEKYSAETFNRNYINWLPQAMYQYKFSAQKSFKVNYTGTTTQPNVTQLQPVKNNDDPLNIIEGNPLLGPSFNNNLNVQYNSYKVLTNQNLYLSASGGFVNNAIVSNNATNAQGVTVYKSINLTEKQPYNYRAYANLSRKMKFLADISVGLGLNLYGNRNYNYVSNSSGISSQLNATDALNLNPSLNFNKYDKKGSFYLSIGPKYISQQASLQKELNNKGWGYSAYFDGNLSLPKKIKLSANADYNFEPSSNSFSENFERFVINADITKSFFKAESLKFRASANDILNQNNGFRRYASGSSIIQNRYNSIGRYLMFSLIWDFNKMGGEVKTK